MRRGGVEERTAGAMDTAVAGWDLVVEGATVDVWKAVPDESSPSQFAPGDSGVTSGYGYPALSGL
jgi:hypothetical protein